VVDTDVISYLFNGHTQAEFFRPYLLNKTLAVSFMTVAQLYYGNHQELDMPIEEYKGEYKVAQVLRLSEGDE